MNGGSMVLTFDGTLEIGALFKAIDLIDSSHNFFSPKKPIFHHVCATCSQLPTNISTIFGSGSDSSVSIRIRITGSGSIYNTQLFFSNTINK